jgi:hypothetical protein
LEDLSLRADPFGPYANCNNKREFVPMSRGLLSPAPSGPEYLPLHLRCDGWNTQRVEAQITQQRTVRPRAMESSSRPTSCFTPWPPRAAPNTPRLLSACAGGLDMERRRQHASRLECQLTSQRAGISGGHASYAGHLSVDS